MAKRLVLVRHGETEWSRERRHTGRTDIPLTQHGRKQAEQLRAVLHEEPFAAVFTSPLIRARETCQLAGFGDGAIVDPDLQEWDYGEYDGMTLKEIQAQRPQWNLWHDGSPGGEKLSDVVARVERVIARTDPIDGGVLLFAHGHVLRALAARWIDAPGEMGQRLALDPASPSILAHEHEWRAIRRWNPASS